MDRNYVDRIQRVVDVSAALVVLVLGSPLILMVAALVAMGLGRPVLFRQQRPGLNGQVFTLVKFRTMRDPAPGRTSDEDRLTRLGRLLRATSLDELPQMWNILRGDMSLIGPRPLLVNYLDLYTPEQARRHLVRPGVTGLAQVRGRNSLSWEDKFALDTFYVDHRSLRLNARICAETVFTVLRRDGVSATGSATMPAFTGSRNA